MKTTFLRTCGKVFTLNKRERICMQPFAGLRVLALWTNQHRESELRYFAIFSPKPNSQADISISIRQFKWVSTSDLSPPTVLTAKADLRAEIYWNSQNLLPRQVLLYLSFVITSSNHLYSSMAWESQSWTRFQWHYVLSKHRGKRQCSPQTAPTLRSQLRWSASSGLQLLHPSKISKGRPKYSPYALKEE